MLMINSIQSCVHDPHFTINNEETTNASELQVNRIEMFVIYYMH